MCEWIVLVQERNWVSGVLLLWLPLTTKAPKLPGHCPVLRVPLLCQRVFLGSAHPQLEGFLAAGLQRAPPLCSCSCSSCYLLLAARHTVGAEEGHTLCFPFSCRLKQMLCLQAFPVTLPLIWCRDLKWSRPRVSSCLFPWLRGLLFSFLSCSLPQLLSVEGDKFCCLSSRGFGFLFQGKDPFPYFPLPSKDICHCI